MRRAILTISIVVTSFGFSLFAAEEEPTAENSSALLPKEYADKYPVASETVSPDQKFALIYPKFDADKDDSDVVGKDYLVALKPFRILCALDTKWPHFEHKNHGGIGADWSKDGSAVLVTLDSKWGPGDIFLYELRDGKLTRATNLLRKIRDLLESDYRKAKSGRYNDYFDFIFESEEKPIVAFKGSTVEIHAYATTDPKQMSGERAWDARFDGVWDIPQAKFTSQKVTRVFAGVRKGEESD